MNHLLCQAGRGGSRTSLSPTMQRLTSASSCRSAWQEADKKDGPGHRRGLCTTCVRPDFALHHIPRRQAGIVASLGHMHSTFVCLPDLIACLLSCSFFFFFFFLNRQKCETAFYWPLFCCTDGESVQSFEFGSRVLVFMTSGPVVSKNRQNNSLT